MAIVAALYSWAYWTHRQTPPFGTFPTRDGWWTRQDPYRYRMQAEAISRLALDGETHHYPIGYALSAAPFCWFDPQHAFFVPNLVFVTSAAMLLYALGRRFLGQVEASAMVLASGWACVELFERALIIPRSTIATHPMAYAMLALLVWRPPSLRLVAQMVLLEGAVYLTRPGDAVFLAPLLVVAVLQLPSWRERAIGATAGPALLSMFLVVNRAINHAVVKSATSFYEEKHSKGFTTTRLFETFYTTWLDGAPIYRDEHVPLLWRMPWVLLAVVGVVWAVRRDSWRQAAVFGTTMGSLCFYLVYQNMCPVSLWDFHLVRYITWTFPILFLFAWLALRFAIWELDRRMVAAMVLVPAVFAWTLRLEEAGSLPVEVRSDGSLVASGDADPRGYDIIVLHEPLEDGTALVHVDGEKLQNPRDMHKRRTAHHETTLRATVLFLHDKVGVERIRLRPELAGRRVELRRLERRLVSLPPELHKRWSRDRLWGVDNPHHTATAGEYRDSSFTTRTESGARVFEAVFHDMGRGRYTVTLSGSADAPVSGSIQIYRHDQLLKSQSTTLHARNGMAYQGSFRLEGSTRELTIRVMVPADRDVSIEQVTLSPTRIH